MALVSAKRNRTMAAAIMVKLEEEGWSADSIALLGVTIALHKLQELEPEDREHKARIASDTLLELIHTALH